MATIANLAVKLSANSAGFVKGMDQAAARTKELEGKAKQVYEATRSPIERYRANVANLNELKSRGLIDSQTYNRALKQETSSANAAGAGIMTLASAKLFLVTATIAAAGAILAMARSGAKSVVETYKLARAVDATAAGFVTVQQGIKMMGGDAEKAGNVLGKLNTVVQDAASGGTAAASIFNRLGLKAEELAGLKSDEAFERVAAAFGKIENAGTRAALASQLFGDDARDVVALLSQGAAGMAKASKQAEDLGLKFSDLDGSRMEDAALSIDKLYDAFKGVSQQVALALLPAFEMASGALSEIGITGKDVGDVLGTALKYTVYGVALVIDAVRVLKLAWQFFVLGATTGTMLIIKGIGKLAEALEKVYRKLGKESWANNMKGIADTAKGMSAGLKDDIKEQIKGIDKTLAKGSALADAINKFDELERKGKQAAEGIKKVKDGLGSLPAVVKLGPIFQEGLKVIEANQSPLQRFRAEMGKLNLMLKHGAITWDIYSRASASALSSLEQANGLNNFNLPAAQGRQSVDAYKSVVQYQANLNNREGPQERVRRVLEESKLIEEKQLEAQRKIADALGNPVQVAKF